MRNVLKMKGPDTENQPMRLNRFLASCGVCSRRKADILIKSGRISVNGSVLSRLSAIVVPGRDDVRVDGNPVSPRSKAYLIMNKPRGVVSSVSDRHSFTILDILPEDTRCPGLFPVGRLDKDSEGLILLTNDGDLAQRIMHPSNGILKTYEVMVDSPLTPAMIESISEGTDIGGRVVRPVGIRMLQREPQGQWIEVVLSEGLKREIRLMAESRGHSVVLLIRTKIGLLKLQDLQPGCSLAVERDRLLNMIFHGGIV